jgi:hypothetical protein
MKDTTTTTIYNIYMIIKLTPDAIHDIKYDITMQKFKRVLHVFTLKGILYM